MTKRISIAGALVLVFWIASASARNGPPDPKATNTLGIEWVTVHGNTYPATPGTEMNLGGSPKDIFFKFGPLPTNRLSARLRYKLENYDTNWQDGYGEMNLNIRFLDDAGDAVDIKQFRVVGESTGWTGTLEGSSLMHRHETIVVPPRATQWQVIISSAGPPSTVGLYVVENLVVSRFSETNPTSEILMQAPPNRSGDENRDPPGWLRDGIRPRMAQIMDWGRDPKSKAFAILDNDPLGHAEWRSRKENVPRVMPGDTLVLDWNELYSIGVGDISVVHYDGLAPGKYQFRVEETGPFGGPAKAATSLAMVVPLPFWQMPWFWATVAVLAVAASTASVRYVTWHKMRRSMAQLQQQRVLEQERLRIAQDIHDDLGARVTQISLVSALAQSNATSLEGARAEFDRISRMSRELISALYETVWAVNPENDNLDAMGNYLCQKINEFCTPAQLRCRLHVGDLPHHVQISSQTRHNISMAVKEALHNSIKHAHASLVTVRVSFSDMLLMVSIEDDGCGFDVESDPSGNGLFNMKRRLEDIGGVCQIESSLGQGTTVQMRLLVKSLDEDRREKSIPRPPEAPLESPPKEDQLNYEKISSRGGG